MAPPTEQAQTKWRPALAALEGRIKEHNMMALLRLELEREVWRGGGPAGSWTGPPGQALDLHCCHPLCNGSVSLPIYSPPIHRPKITIDWTPHPGIDASRGYDDANTMIVPRGQFLMVEVARNREGANQPSMLRDVRTLQARRAAAPLAPCRAEVSI